MAIIECKDYEEMSIKAAELVQSIVRVKPNALLCCATGHSPRGLYAEMKKMTNSNPRIFDQVSIVQLDEWIGLSKDSPVSCKAYLQKHLIDPLCIEEGRSFGFNSDVSDLNAECYRMESFIERNGPIDLCILGLGKNGHLGFNEPADFLNYYVHIATLSPISVKHDMVTNDPQQPEYGLTIGMKGIMNSKKVILLITGEGKKPIINEWRKKQITSHLPASMLWLHSDLYVFIDMESL